MRANGRANCQNYGNPVLNSTSFLAKMGFTLKALNQQSRYLIEISGNMCNTGNVVQIMIIVAIVVMSKNKSYAMH